MKLVFWGAGDRNGIDLEYRLHNLIPVTEHVLGTCSAALLYGALIVPLRFSFTMHLIRFLDYSKVHRLHQTSAFEPDGSTARCFPFFSPGFALRYLLSDGLIFMAAGLAAVIVSSIVSGRYTSCLSSEVGNTDDQDCGDGVEDRGPNATARCHLTSTSESFGVFSAAARGSHGGKGCTPSDCCHRFRPLESFGSFSGTFGRMLLSCLPPQSTLEDLMARISCTIDKSTAVGAVCLPTGGYYLLRALLARVDMKVGMLISVALLALPLSHRRAAGICHNVPCMKCGPALDERAV